MMESPTRASNPLHTVFMRKPPCCLELHPIRRDYFVVGTYELAKVDPNNSALEVEQQRDGSLDLYQVVGGSLSEVQSLSLPSAILDVHWQTQVGVARLGAVTSTGSFVLCDSRMVEDRLRLRHTHTIQLCDPRVLMTAFAWDPLDTRSICFTASNGDVGTFSDIPNIPDARTEEPLPMAAEHTEHVQVLFTHGLEAWTATYHQTEAGQRGVYSGGDDCVLRWSPLDEDSAKVAPAWGSDRSHFAGVVSIMPLCEGFVATGSYDDHLRIFELRRDGRGPQRAPKAEMIIGGGVWRLIDAGRGQSDEDLSFNWRFLVCCMYAGARVVDVKMDAYGTWKINMIARFTEHQSMCYGGGVLDPSSLVDELPAANAKLEDGGAQSFGFGGCNVTCSFDDKRLCLWSF